MEPSRSGFKQVFGNYPNVLNANKAKLEKIRQIRNDYAHGFGRDLDVPPPTNWSPGLSRRLNAQDALDYLGVISRVAAGIDTYLLNGFIGNFELLLFYHEFKDRPLEGREKSYAAHRQLQRALNKDAALTTPADFCRDLISYYRST